jgi:CcmD family protein
MSTGSQYVVAAYAVIWFILLLYVVVLASRTARMGREVELLGRLLDRSAHPPDGDDRRPEGAPRGPGRREPSGLR